MVLESVLGTAIGLVMGLTGAGGGILAVPALVVALGVDMVTAAPVALIAVGLSAMLGAIDGLRRGWVRYKAAMLMSVVGGLLSPLGAAIARLLPVGLLMIIFGCVMLIVAFRSYQKATCSADSENCENANKACMLSPSTGRFIWNRRSALTLAGIGAVSGLFTGMLGVGGGFIIVPALQRFSNVSMHGIVATSLMVIGLISAVTVSQAVSLGLQWPTHLTWFVVFALVGMFAGRAVSPHLPARTLQMAFSMVCVGVAFIILAKGFGIL